MGKPNPQGENDLVGNEGSIEAEPPFQVRQMTQELVSDVRTAVLQYLHIVRRQSTRVKVVFSLEGDICRLGGFRGRPR